MEGVFAFAFFGLAIFAGLGAWVMSMWNAGGGKSIMIFLFPPLGFIWSVRQKERRSVMWVWIAAAVFTAGGFSLFGEAVVNASKLDMNGAVVDTTRDTTITPYDIKPEKVKRDIYNLKTTPKKKPGVKVEYKVTGSRTFASVTYENETGGTVQRSRVLLPWSYSFRGMPGQFVYVSAQNLDDVGSLVATIEVDGIIVKNSESSGGYVIATASGSL